MLISMFACSLLFWAPRGAALCSPQLRAVLPSSRAAMWPQWVTDPRCRLSLHCTVPHDGQGFSPKWPSGPHRETCGQDACPHRESSSSCKSSPQCSETATAMCWWVTAVQPVSHCPSCPTLHGLSTHIGVSVGTISVETAEAEGFAFSTDTGSRRKQSTCAHLAGEETSLGLVDGEHSYGKLLLSAWCHHSTAN